MKEYSPNLCRIVGAARGGGAEDDVRKEVGVLAPTWFQPWLYAQCCQVSMVGGSERLANDRGPWKLLGERGGWMQGCLLSESMGREVAWVVDASTQNVHKY